MGKVVERRANNTELLKERRGFGWGGPLSVPSKRFKNKKSIPCSERRVFSYSKFRFPVLALKRGGPKGKNAREDNCQKGFPGKNSADEGPSTVQGVSHVQVDH